MPALMIVILSFASILGAHSSPKAVAPLGGGVAVFVTGSVVDASSMQALAGAQVYVPVASSAALTNSGGRFMASLDDGYVGQEVEVVAQLIGYASQRITIRLTEGENALDFRLQAVAVELDELAVAPGREAGSSIVSGGLSLSVASDRGVVHNTEAYAHIEESGFRPVDGAAVHFFYRCRSGFLRTSAGSEPVNDGTLYGIN